MQEFVKNKIDTLADLFCAWMGGIPDNDNEIKEFLQKNEELAELINHRDIEHIVHFHASFPPETVRAVYSLIPVKIPLANGKELVIFEKKFMAMNEAESRRLNSRTVNVDMSRAYKFFMTKYPSKARFMAQNKIKFKSHNERVLFPNRQKESYHRRRAEMTEEEKEISRAKSREYRRKWRAANPEKVAKDAAKQKERRKNRTFLQVINDRITSRKSNKKYRENNRELISKRRVDKRQLLKQENPELLKEMDKKSNSCANRKKICSDYYQKHKEEISLRAKNNPKVKGYKQKYKIKKRWREKTGPAVMSLLQAIVAQKQCGKI